MMVRLAWSAVLIFSASNLFGGAISVDLGSADSYSVLAGTTVTSTNSTTINGNLGVWSGSSITGFPPGIVTGGVIHAGDSFAQQAQADLTTAYNFAAGETGATTLTGDLNGMVLTPGVYKFDSTATLAINGVLTLNALGDANAVFLFQIGSSLTTGSGSTINITNPGTGDSVFWQVGGSANLGTNSAFAGNILALNNVTVSRGATINCGRALARNGAVTLDQNNISIDMTGCEAGGSFAPSSVPEPASLVLSGFGLLALSLIARRLRRV